MSAFKDAQMHYLQGCNIATLIRLLWTNRKHLTIKAFPRIIYVVFMSIILSPFVLVEQLLHARKIRKTEIKKDPIFIVGHWRSGTTYLTNIMANDKDKGYFTVAQTFTHSVFITLEKVLKKTYKSVMPETRPMDNMKMDFELPQEEIFALANKTPDAIVHMLSFPRNARFYAKCAFYHHLSPRRQARLSKNYYRIIQKVTYYTGGKQLVVKSPDNTCRMKMLLELFPNAKFIHICRNPYKVFRSTMGMYRTLFPLFSLEELNDEVNQQAEDIIFDIYEEFYHQYLNDRQLIPEGNLIELKYEDFIQQPLDYIQKIYATLNIDGFEKAKAEMQTYIESQHTYKTNPHTIDEKNKKRLNKRMGFLFKQFGYAMDTK